MGYFRNFGLGTAVSGFALAAVVATPAAAIDLSYAYHFPDKGAVSETMKWWAGQLDERTSGEVTVEIFWRQALTKFRATFSAVQSGEADIGELASTFSQADTGAWAIADTGKGSSDQWVVTKALDNMRGSFSALDDQLATWVRRFAAAVDPTMSRVASEATSSRSS